jgi:hypothetical protein
MDTRNEYAVIVRAFRVLLDKGMAIPEVAELAVSALGRAAVDPERCGHIIAKLDGTFYRCARNAGHEGEHGRRK